MKDVEYSPDDLTTANAVDLYVGGRIRFLRTARSIPPTEFANGIGTSVVVLSQYEAGTVTVPAQTLYSIARRLGVKINCLFALPAERLGS